MEWPAAAAGRQLTLLDHPTQYRTLNVLAALPVRGALACAFLDTAELRRDDQAKVLESV